MATSRYTPTLLTTITNLLGPDETQPYITNVIYALRYPDVCGNRADESLYLLRPFAAAAAVHNEIARVTHDSDSDLNLPRVEADDASLQHSLYVVRLICRGMPDNVHDVRWQVLGFADQSVWQRRVREQIRMQRMSQALPVQQQSTIIVDEIYGDESISIDGFQGESFELRNDWRRP